MKAFFESHQCTYACRLLGLKEVDPRTLKFAVAANMEEDVLMFNSAAYVSREIRRLFSS